MEHDLHDRQEAYSILKDLNKSQRDKLNYYTILEQEWLNYFFHLQKQNESVGEHVLINTNINVDLIMLDKLKMYQMTPEIKKKTPGYNGLNSGHFIYASLKVIGVELKIISI